MLILPIYPPLPSLKESLKLSFDIVCLYLLSFFLFAVLICASLFPSQSLQGYRLSAAISVPASGFIYPSSIPCFSTSSSILSVSMPALALPYFFNPSGSGSVAIKEGYFTRSQYRFVLHKRLRSLCATARAFKAVSVQ